MNAPIAPCLLLPLLVATPQDPVGPAPSLSQAPPLSERDVLLDEELEGWVDEMARLLLEQELTPGFVVGVTDGERRWTRGYGRLSAEDERSPDARTLFEIGSLSKVFTGVLLAEGARRGELALEDPLQDHLREGLTAPGDPERPIRLEHLAIHASGLPRMPPGMHIADPARPYAGHAADEVQTWVDGCPTLSLPGETYLYSNFGFGLLGNVVAHAAGGTYDQVLRARIAGPLGMTDTCVVPGEAQRARLAPGHDHGLREVPGWRFDVLAGAGGIHSTVSDLLAFAEANLRPSVDGLGPALEAARARRWRPEGTVVEMGLGWHRFRASGAAWHNGQTGGHHSFLVVHPERRQAVVVLSHCADAKTEALGLALHQRLLGEDPAPPFEVRLAAEVPRDRLARLVGRYRLENGELFRVSLQPQGLFVRLGEQDDLRVYPASPTEFFYRVVDAELTFELDEGGHPVRLLLHQHDHTQPAERVQ